MISKWCIVLLFGCSTLVFGQQWESNFDSALDRAAKEAKPILLVFSGSDWCAPCRKLDRDIWQSETFIAYASEHYILYKADFPRKQKNKLLPDIAATNAKLAERFNPKGYFPLIVLMDEKSKVYAEMGYQRGSPQAYLDRLNSYLQ
ncbi:MAG: thioredoxin family protein [Bacteroidota bacterium]